MMSRNDCELCLVKLYLSRALGTNADGAPEPALMGRFCM